MIADDNSKLSKLSRPGKELRIDQLRHSENLWGYIGQGSIGYAGHAENPRPLPQWTFYDVKKRLQISIQSWLGKAEMKLPFNTIVYALASDRQVWKPEEVITVPWEDLWWFASSSDMVLLSDDLIDHYTTIASVDRENERIYFTDPWPDIFFLKEDLNLAEVRAQIEFIDDAQKKALFSISKEEFFDVIVGILTIDTTELIEHYFRYQPEQKNNPDFNLRYGIALLDVNHNELASLAASHIKKALDLAFLSNQQIEINLATSKLFMALNLASFYALKNDDKLLLKPFQEELKCLTKDYSRQFLLNGLKADELGRLGDLAGHIGNMEAAAEFFNWAITQDPHHEYVHLLRAKAIFNQQQFSDAIADLNTALKLNEENMRQAEQELEKKDLKGWIERGEDEARLARLKELREEEIFLRTIAYIALGQTERARQNLQLLKEINPQNSNIKFISQGIEQMEANPDMAQQDFLEALKYSRDHNYRAFMNQKLKEITERNDGDEN